MFGQFLFGQSPWGGGALSGLIRLFERVIISSIQKAVISISSMPKGYAVELNSFISQEVPLTSNVFTNNEVEYL